MKIEGFWINYGINIPLCENEIEEFKDDVNILLCENEIEEDGTEK